MSLLISLGFLYGRANPENSVMEALTTFVLFCFILSQRTLLKAVCADPEGGQGVRTPPSEKSQNHWLS